MNEEELERLGRTMAGVLRHFPDRFDLKMDPRGFVNLREFVAALNRKQRRFRWVRPHHIQAVVDTDPKGRYEIRDSELLRATYAHSFDVELDLPTFDIPDELFYPTTPEESDILLETGLKPSDRKKVHLSKTPQDAANAGRVRTPAPVILRVDARRAQDAGIVIQKAGKTVYLVDEVPHEFLSKTDFVLPPQEAQPAEPAPAEPEELRSERGDDEQP